MEQRTVLWGRQKKFVEAYLSYGCKDVFKAYKEAGYKARGDNGVESASRLLAQPQIQAEIQRRIDEVEKKANISLLDLVERLKKICTFDIRDLYTVDGNLRPVHELNDKAVLMVENIEITETEGGKYEGTTTKVKLWKIKEAYETLIKILGGGSSTLKVTVDGEVKHDVEVKGGVLMIPGARSLADWTTLIGEVNRNRDIKRLAVEARILEADQLPIEEEEDE
jgi:phage terminase small subunit